MSAPPKEGAPEPKAADATPSSPILSLHDELLVHCVRRGNARDDAALCASCRAINNALRELPNDVWKEFAFARFARMASLWRAVQNLSELDHMWKSIYREQLVADNKLPEARCQTHILHQRIHFYDRDPSWGERGVDLAKWRSLGPVSWRNSHMT